MYLDHAATTPISASALAALTSELSRSGNPSSLHGSGRRARMVVEESREALAAAAGCHPSEIIFTSGGTEADNLAVKGLYWSRRDADPRRTRILCSPIEHHAVLDTVQWLEKHEGATVVWLPVDSDGVVSEEAIRTELAAHADSTALLTVMWANNEVGTVQNIPGLTALAHEYGVPVHTDAVQAFGALPVDFRAAGVDTMAISGHKIGGPVGVGALVVGRAVKLTPVMHGGGQERDIRSGTLDMPGIAAFAAAAREVTENLPAESARLRRLRDTLIAGVEREIPDAVLRGAREEASGNDGSAGSYGDTMPRRLPGNAHFTFPGCEGDSLLFLLDLAGVESSTGSACTAGVPRPSHVLLAMGLTETEARGAQRFSLGHTTTAADVDTLLRALPEAYERAKKAGMASHVSSIQTAGTGFTS